MHASEETAASETVQVTVKLSALAKAKARVNGVTADGMTVYKR